MLSVNDFASKIKAKYPQYNSVDNTTLVNKIIEKYPVYKSQVDLSSSGASSEAQKPGFFQSVVQNIAKPFLDFYQTVKNPIVATADLLQGKIKQGNEALSATTNVPFFGEAKPLARNLPGTQGEFQDIERAAGAGAQIGATISPVKTLGANVLSGTFFGAGANLEASADQQEGLLRTALNTGIGGIIGAGTALVLHGLFKIPTAISKTSLAQEVSNHFEAGKIIGDYFKDLPLISSEEDKQALTGSMVEQIGRLLPTDSGKYVGQVITPEQYGSLPKKIINDVANGAWEGAKKALLEKIPSRANLSLSGGLGSLGFLLGIIRTGNFGDALKDAAYGVALGTGFGSLQGGITKENIAASALASGYNAWSRNVISFGLGLQKLIPSIGIDGVQRLLQNSILDVTKNINI